MLRSTQQLQVGDGMETEGSYFSFNTRSQLSDFFSNAKSSQPKKMAYSGLLTCVPSFHTEHEYPLLNYSTPRVLNSNELIYKYLWVQFVLCFSIIEIPTRADEIFF